MRRSRAAIEVEISGGAIRGFTRRAIAAFVRECLDELRRAKAGDTERTSVSIAFVSDREMRLLNGRYRGRRRTTDVLTFEATDDDVEPDTSRRPLGEIVISVDQARRQALSERHALATEIRYLLLHGIIHALGYDHETDDGEMNLLEIRIRRRVGLD